MIATREEKTMLYCPKCRRTYEEGTQRFCDNDGGRLLPAPTSPARGDQSGGGLFTNLLGKSQAPDRGDRKPSAAPRFVPLNQTDESDKKLTSFPSAGRIFQSEKVLRPEDQVKPNVGRAPLELDPVGRREEDEDILELDVERLFTEIAPDPSIPQTGPLQLLDPLPTIQPAPVEKPIEKIAEKPAEPAETQPAKTTGRLVRPDEIASGTGTTGDRSVNPLGRAALTHDNPSALVGSTVKGRYRVAQVLENDDEDSFKYLAEDQISSGRMVVVRVFMNDDAISPEEARVLAEERISLSHLNHPNVAGVFDSGELPEGRGFIVSEYVEGRSLAELLDGGQFNPLRTARIVRQTSYALSEAHQNGILHRSIKPENIVLTVSDAGIEQVKLMNFGVSLGEINDSNVDYKAPEEIERGESTFSSDIYALAAVAYQMLTARAPFSYANESELVRAQKAGLKLPPSNWRLDVQPLADKIIEKGLSYNAADRYPKARDFGDALFNALTTVAPWAKDDEAARQEPEKPREYVVVPALGDPLVTSKFDEDQPGLSVAAPVVAPIAKPVDEIPMTADAPLAADIHITPKEDEEAFVDADSAATPAAWERRSPEPPTKGITWRVWAVVAAVVAGLLLLWGLSQLARYKAKQDDLANTQQNAPLPTSTASDPMPSVDGDVPPSPRSIKLPEGFVRFQNTRETQTGDLAKKNFLGFGVGYPEDWTKGACKDCFLDVAKKDDGVPVEQFLVHRYESRGTMTLDRPNFQKLAAASNADLKKFFGDTYRVLGQGETKVQNGRWSAYEVKFQGTSPDGKVKWFGRRLWMPVQAAGEQNGFVLTLIGTSLSDEIKNVDDIGSKGRLGEILETFEPEIK